MLRSRRAVLTGAGAFALTGSALAQDADKSRLEKFRERRAARRNAAPAPAPVTGHGYAAAAAYSAIHYGVSMLVMQGGKILFEDYPAPNGAVDKGWELASGTKSFTGVMAAAASADGLLSIEEKAADTLDEWAKDPGLSKITLRHILSLTSGINVGSPTASPPTYSAAAASARAVHAPGARFQYGPEPFQIFGEILTRKLKARGLSANPVTWLQQRVFDPIGVKPTDWKTGADGLPYLPQGGHFTARNWATFGQWVMDGGRGADPAVVSALHASSSANPGYGLSWWLLRPGLIGPSPRAGVNAETIGDFALTLDISMAAGAGNQRLYLCRKHNLVVVRQANRILEQMRKGSAFKDGEFLEILLG